MFMVSYAPAFMFQPLLWTFEGEGVSGSRFPCCLEKLRKLARVGIRTPAQLIGSHAVFAEITLRSRAIFFF